MMKKIITKNVFLTIGTAALTLVPISTIVACGGNTQKLNFGVGLVKTQQMRSVFSDNDRNVVEKAKKDWQSIYKNIQEAISWDELDEIKVEFQQIYKKVMNILNVDLTSSSINEVDKKFITDNKDYFDFLASNPTHGFAKMIEDKRSKLPDNDHWFVQNGWISNDGLTLSRPSSFHLTSFTRMPNAKIPSSVTKIEIYAFHEPDNTESVNFPWGFTIPSNVTEIGTDAFQSVNFKNLFFLPTNIKFGKSSFSGISVRYPSFTLKNVLKGTIDDWAFSNAKLPVDFEMFNSSDVHIANSDVFSYIRTWDGTKIVNEQDQDILDDRLIPGAKIVLK